ncbi:FlgB family protein [Pararhodobacter sp.]|uniref:FlgB family protein n=1 Tax=Pararhodobacter sp. TaxID=2127056 RepID=UPI002FE05789|nr:FlgB family protein [Pseudomonadota bacterium]
MFDSLDIMRMAQAFAAHAATRQQAVSQNVANADTPGYRSRDAIPFTEYWRASQERVLARGDILRADEQPATVAPDGNTVSVEFEMMRAVEARQQHEMALGIYAMSRDLLRASLGK